jgi:hypothetical protein
MIRSDSRATNRVARKIAARSFGPNDLVIFDGKTFARQRISSAIQLPMPEKPDCINRTALIGALP